ncbi:hypothetical protein ALC62_11631 [Cyphomyrmex costatus]|uniref:Uncharacterized protein n=1 Tax=Cyphomyrmex costatus TaxID=456900 RepID=A0A151IC80_9HYME|nr:hypothetical protein ALC62_11631 [Cyphomyrmex costatus]
MVAVAEEGNWCDKKESLEDTETTLWKLSRDEVVAEDVETNQVAHGDFAAMAVKQKLGEMPTVSATVDNHREEKYNNGSLKNRQLSPLLLLCPHAIGVSPKRFVALQENSFKTSYIEENFKLKMNEPKDADHIN